ncbi:MAG TPA: PQQ-dependent sugar dehydrogenase, partial [Armatimonadota bacterium]|nr:PQQ-dependent sugar dehydrogenase [Armatimonadota bacterium]
PKPAKSGHGLKNHPLPLLLLLLALSGCQPAGPGRTPGGAEVAVEASSAPERGGTPPMPRPVIRKEVPEVRVEVIARDLQIPWALAFAPDGRLFFTERPGRIRVLRPGEPPRTYADLNQVTHRGEGGLMGLALHPRFPRQPYLYVMYTTRVGRSAVNRISRFTDTGTGVSREKILIDGIPAAQFHDGGALAFGPDGMLYAGTGDARNPPSSQDLHSLNGKILRVTPDGKVPKDNPFPGSPVWACGFRNVSALAWQPGTGQLWAANHGPSGEFPGLHASDAVYKVRKGGNHGWPLVVGTTTRREIVSPVLYYPDEAVPPGGALFYTGQLFPRFRGDYFLATLKSAHLQRVTLRDGRIAGIERWWPEKYGRLRALAQGPDGAIYFSTSNRDGRAERSYPGSDYIYRIVPAR